ncbi:MAG TPA: iron-sulfur cluster co-chaperone HscB C-terminal domain-containing protein [Saprospiraceae bacterium]|nr:iron-sulfur cluster co-chaperone HscB C-terminal domain-containing protein [Saprospiraceae bacterium]
MNYFEFYQLEPKILLDLNVLRQKFYAKSRELHPDQNNKLDLSENEIQYDSAFNNIAYKTLGSFETRLKYILELESIIIESQQKNQLSEDFLMEMLELHEEIIEAKHLNQIEELSKLEDSIRIVEEKNLQEILPFMTDYDSGKKLENTLLNLQQYYYKLKYFNRLKSAIKGDSVEL